MDWFSTAFIKASLVWLGLGVALGVSIALHPAWIVYKPAHTHMNLLGFAGMMISGVAYYVLPRFTGHPLHSRRLAGWHWWMSNAGLAAMVAGFALAPRFVPAGGAFLAAGGLLSAAGSYTFIYNIWRTIDGSAVARRDSGVTATIALGRRPAARP
jgi:cbb3-type cytochrome oxidase subunit 1